MESAGSLDWGGIGEPAEDFHRPISVTQQENNDASSFTALLELPPNQAMELLVQSTDKSLEEAAAEAEIGDNPLLTTYATPVPLPSPHHLLVPIFPSNAALVDGGGMFTRLANTERKLTANSEGSDSDPNSNSFSSVPNAQPKLKSSTKRKVREKKEKEEEGEGGSNRKKAAKEEGAEKGDYVHVRARRGQATDSHSLAERARREKINAKMKLLQEMVPGCNKISGTALVLDEIINHVQTLQRQIEILSMRLAAVNTTTNFGFETFMPNECFQDGSTMDNDFPGMMMVPSDWQEDDQEQKNGVQHKQLWHSNDYHQLNWPNSNNSKEDDHLNFNIQQESQLAYASSSVPAALDSNQVKMEL